MDKVQESWFPSQHSYRVWVKYNIESAILTKFFGSWYRRFPIVKVDNTSETSNVPENKKIFQIGTNSYNENLTQELIIYTDKIAVYPSNSCRFWLIP